MKPQVLTDGIKFAVKYSLTKREMEILSLFLEKSLTTAEAAKILQSNPNPVHHTIQRLKLRNILVFKSRDSQGNNMLMFNEQL
jgi:DNA-binding CsgD family transcriptional regulator